MAVDVGRQRMQRERAVALIRQHVRQDHDAPPAAIA